MKRTAMILGTAFLLLASAVKAQTDTVPAKTQPETSISKETTTQPLTTSAATDRWNSWSPDKYKMLPMPAPLTTEKIFPVIGQYTVASAEHASMDANTTPMNVSIMLDENSKGIAWVDGLPQGRIKAYLQKSPATYMIPTQKSGSEKDIESGVLIYDKDSNKLDVCIGCKYNAEDPASAFTQTSEPAVDEPVIAKTAKSKKSAAKKSKPLAKTTWKYSGTKNVETTASVMSVN